MRRLKYTYEVRRYSNGRPNIVLDIEDYRSYQVTQDVPHIDLESDEYVMTRTNSNEDYKMLKSTGLLERCVKKVVTRENKCYDVGKFTPKFVDILKELGYID